MIQRVRKIRQLSQDVAEKIAAGEVVERPESIVKEVIENALDAGAKNIRVTLKNGGKDLIRVQDDGEGIPADELPLAVSRYATSKIQTPDDLFDINSYGFRGEALASIGRVAALKIQTRPEGSEGAQITVTGGDVSPITPAACPKGTIIEVRDLFFSVPARRKFLKRGATEFGRASDWVLRAALSATDTGFQLTHDDKTIWHIRPDTSLAERMGIFYGPDIANRLLPVNHEGPVSVTGLVGRPEIARRDRRAVLFFVNNRFIRDKMLQQALREAFRGYLIPGKFPLAVLFLQVDPDTIDVNVHPAKAEIRFQNGQVVFQGIFRAVKQALTGLGPRVIPIEKPAGQAIAGEAEAMADFFLPGPAAGKTSAQGGLPAGTGDARSGPVRDDIPSLPFSPSRSMDVTDTLPDLPPPPASGASDAGAVKTVLQAGNTYLVFETPDGIEIADQHALHEKILFHEILDRLKRGGLPVQALLIPATVRLTPEEGATAMNHAATLGKLGLTMEMAGPDLVTIKSVPALGKTEAPEALFRSMLAACQDNSTADPFRPLAEKMACAMAVKGGQKLPPEERAQLIKKAADLAGLETCPHGRPTVLQISFSQLEKHFDRTG